MSVRLGCRPDHSRGCGVDPAMARGCAASHSIALAAALARALRAPRPSGHGFDPRHSVGASLATASPPWPRPCEPFTAFGRAAGHGVNLAAVLAQTLRRPCQASHGVDPAAALARARQQRRASCLRPVLMRLVVVLTWSRQWSFRRLLRRPDHDVGASFAVALSVQPRPCDSWSRSQRRRAHSDLKLRAAGTRCAAGQGM